MLSCSERIKLEGIIANINGELISKVPFLNRGGCGFFAYELSKALHDIGVDNSIRIDSGLVSITRNKETLRILCMDDGSREKLDLFLSEEKRFGKPRYQEVSCSHAYVHIPELKMFVDGHERGIDEVKFGGYRDNDGEYTLAEMEKALLFGDWNKMFDRDKYGETVKTVIQRNMKTLKI